jgi:hypothetical protein
MQRISSHRHCRLRLFASDFWIRLSNPLRALLRLLSLWQILRPLFWLYLLLPPVLEPGITTTITTVISIVGSAVELTRTPGQAAQGTETLNSKTKLIRRSCNGGRCAFPNNIIKVAASSEVDYCFFAHELRENRNGSGSFCFLLLCCSRRHPLRRGGLLRLSPYTF